MDHAIVSSSHAAEHAQIQVFNKRYIRYRIGQVFDRINKAIQRRKVLLKDTANDDLISVRYQAPKIKNSRQAIYWFAALIHTSILEVKTVILSDVSQASVTDTALTFDFDAFDINYQFLKNEIIKHHTDDLSLIGSYRKQPIVLGINLHSGCIVVCFFKDLQIDEKELERQLKIEKI